MKSRTAGAPGWQSWLRAAATAALCAALANTLAAAPALAAPPSAYQVEVLIIAPTTAPAGEDLTRVAEGRGFGDAADAGTDAPTVLHTLDASQLQLGGLAAKLRASHLWRVLAHGGWIQTATDWPHHGGLALEDLGLRAEGLGGRIYVERGQYLHLGFDLQLGSTPAWTLRELRKVKFGEKNYFDHPGFGVIAIVSPAKVPPPTG